MPTAHALRSQSCTPALLCLPGREGDWTARERRQLSRLVACAAIQDWDLSYGCAEAGAPWCIVHDMQGDVVVHIARIERRYVVGWQQGQQSARFMTLKAAVDLALRAIAQVGHRPTSKTAQPSS